MMNRPSNYFIGAVFDNHDNSLVAVEQLIKHDFPTDQVSNLRRAGRMGDDFPGGAYTDEKERFKV